MTTEGQMSDKELRMRSFITLKLGENLHPEDHEMWREFRDVLDAKDAAHKKESDKFEWRINNQMEQNSDLRAQLAEKVDEISKLRGRGFVLSVGGQLELEEIKKQLAELTRQRDKAIELAQEELAEKDALIATLESENHVLSVKIDRMEWPEDKKDAEIAKLEAYVGGNMFMSDYKSVDDMRAEIARLKEAFANINHEPEEQLKRELTANAVLMEKIREALVHCKNRHHKHFTDSYVFTACDIIEEALSLLPNQALDEVRLMRAALDSARSGLACMSEYIQSKGLPFAFRDSVKETERLVVEALDRLGKP